jgi:hypothetical protein
MHTHTCISHIHTHVHAYAHIHACPHAYIQTQMHTSKCTCLLAHTHAYIHTHACMHTSKHTCMCLNVCIHRSGDDWESHGVIPCLILRSEKASGSLHFVFFTNATINIGFPHVKKTYTHMRMHTTTHACMQSADRHTTDESS